jgi:hypothetical protein
MIPCAVKSSFKSEPECLNFQKAQESIPWNHFRQPLSLAGRNDNSIPTRFLASIDSLKFQHWFTDLSLEINHVDCTARLYVFPSCNHCHEIPNTGILDQGPQPEKCFFYNWVIEAGCVNCQRIWVKSMSSSAT